MALQYVSVACVYVNDQDKALDFYTGKLGFTKTTDAQFGEGMRWLEVKTPEGNTSLALLKSGEYGPDNYAGKSSGLVFYSDDVAGMCSDLKTKGVNITEDANAQPWGVQAQFDDLDGNGFVVVGK